MVGQDDEPGKRTGYEKAGRFPMRAYEGPAKNPLLKRRKNVQPNMKIQSSCAGFSSSVAKELIGLGWFSYAFAEITDGMSTEPEIRGRTKPDFLKQSTPYYKEMQALIPFFSDYFTFF